MTVNADKGQAAIKRRAEMDIRKASTPNRATDRPIHPIKRLLINMSIKLKMA